MYGKNSIKNHHINTHTHNKNGILAWCATRRRRRSEGPYYCYVHYEIWPSTKSKRLPCVSLKHDASSQSAPLPHPHRPITMVGLNVPGSVGEVDVTGMVAEEHGSVLRSDGVEEEDSKFEVSASNDVCII